MGALYVPLSISCVVKLPAADVAWERSWNNDKTNLLKYLQAPSQQRAPCVEWNSPRWNFSWCFSRAKRDLKQSSQYAHLKGLSWECRIICSSRWGRRVKDLWQICGGKQQHTAFISHTDTQTRAAVIMTTHKTSQRSGYFNPKGHVLKSLKLVIFMQNKETIFNCGRNLYWHCWQNLVSYLHCSSVIPRYMSTRVQWKTELLSKNASKCLF